ncbi:MAG: hypothetical protein M3O15_11120, partial [Acidobacteriota bacterium]|nr:hypothetical protein [Acidobacteriota bacterium]
MSFLAAVDEAVAAALPRDWPRVAPERLPARGDFRVRYACACPALRGQRAFLSILALDGREQGLSGGPAGRDLLALRDFVLARGAHLLVLYPQASHESLDELGVFLREELELPHPRLLVLPCARDAAGAWTTADPTGAGEAPVARVIRGYWSGHLVFEGPGPGRQRVGVERMCDRCWRCHAPIETVTGIVLPDRPVGSWPDGDWLYYCRLLPTGEIEAEAAQALALSIDAWRAQGATHVTPLQVRFGRSDGRSYWAAVCPDCHALRGAFHIEEARLAHLHDRESRRTGALKYRSLDLEVTLPMLQQLAAGAEI